MNRNLKFIGLHYGYKAQAQMLIEEMAELTKALCKYNRSTDITEQMKLWTNIEEELADVLVLSNQFLEIWANKEKVETIMEIKINRQLNRIMEETKK